MEEINNNINSNKRFSYEVGYIQGHDLSIGEIVSNIKGIYAELKEGEGSKNKNKNNNIENRIRLVIRQIESTSRRIDLKTKAIETANVLGNYYIKLIPTKNKGFKIELRNMSSNDSHKLNESGKIVIEERNLKSGRKVLVNKEDVYKSPPFYQELVSYLTGLTYTRGEVMVDALKVGGATVKSVFISKASLEDYIKHKKSNNKNNKTEAQLHREYLQLTDRGINTNFINTLKRGGGISREPVIVQVYNSGTEGSEVTKNIPIVLSEYSGEYRVVKSDVYKVTNSSGKVIELLLLEPYNNGDRGIYLISN